MKILIIANNELCYNPRLLKSAEFAKKLGAEVDVFNPITNVRSKILNEEIFDRFRFNQYSNNISKDSLASSFNWFYVSILHLIYSKLWRWFGFFNSYVLNKGLIGNNVNKKMKYDFIIINLIDNLSFAIQISKKSKARVLFDSQEYFVGQYNKYESWKLKWVVDSHAKFIGDCHIVTSTTNVMKDVLQNDYNLKVPIFRLRNLPSSSMLGANQFVENCASDSKQKLKFIWHGHTVYFGNTRGLDILMEAVSLCRCDCDFYIQGIITDAERAKFEDRVTKWNITSKVHLVDAAKPLEIINSIRKYDVGLLGELAEEENQILTSSNKMFDYIHAGLFVLGPNLPGIAETIDGLQTGLLYETGNPVELARKMEFLDSNREFLKKRKNQNENLAREELKWEDDFSMVYNEMQRQSNG
jgi:glycosyltransferase involved in cell wall biosynthesis